MKKQNEKREVKRKASVEKSKRVPKNSVEKKKRTWQIKRKKQKNGEAMQPAKQGHVGFFSIRKKLAFSLVVPIVFMIIIGIAAYKKAEQGMGEKFSESTIQAVQMVSENIDTGCGFLKAEAISYVTNAELRELYGGRLDDDLTQLAKLERNLEAAMQEKITGNAFIENIHMIPEADNYIYSTYSSMHYNGILAEYQKNHQDAGGKLKAWIDIHEDLDKVQNAGSSSYIMAYQVMASGNKACIVFDVKKNAVQDLLDVLDFGTGSVIGFVTEGGRELISTKAAESGKFTTGSTFFGQKFYEEAVAGSEATLYKEVKYSGKKYMFFFCKSEMTGASVCALVPFSQVTKQARDIMVLSLILVVLAILVVAAIGVFITSGIQQNMELIAGKFGEVAQGNLAVEVKAKGNDEFQTLASSATEMVSNTKNLVVKVKAATVELEQSSDAVKTVSDGIDQYSRNITESISEINRGMERQSRHAQECVEKTDALSGQIQEITGLVGQVERIAHETEEMIGQGVEIVTLLGNLAKETTQITSDVGENISELSKESTIINNFVETITEISGQTNLLSLNASIEAARAGAAGRGFSVVAEEIRKLADSSASVAREIGGKIARIEKSTAASVTSAKTAENKVAKQTEAVEQVISLFREMQLRLENLVTELTRITERIQQVDEDKSETVNAVRNISEIIGETAENTEKMSQVAEKLRNNVDNLNDTANALGENMDELKTEISLFRL